MAAKHQTMSIRFRFIYSRFSHTHDDPESIINWIFDSHEKIYFRFLYLQTV